MGKFKSGVSGSIKGKPPIPGTKSDPLFRTFFPKVDKPEDAPPPPPEETIPEMPDADPDNELLRQRKRRAAAAKQQSGRASTLLTSNQTLGG